MKDTLKNKCDLFADNYIIMKKNFPWNYSSYHRLGALLYTLEDRRVDADAINYCKKLIKEYTGVFSRFRDITFFMTAVLLSMKSNPEEVLKAVIDIYGNMKKEGFRSSVYLVLAAIFIAVQTEPHEYTRVIATSKKYYDTMKAHHRFLTTASDYGYAALLAMTEKSVSVATRDMEACYQRLTTKFFSRNAIQSLSHVLAFGEEDSIAKAERVIRLYQELINRGCRFGTGLELPVIGSVALLTDDVNETADQMVEINEYLKHKKGFGIWLSNRERLMYVAALVSKDYAADRKDKTIELSLTNSITGILLAQQMAMVAAASASASASAAASSSNG